MAEFVDRRMQEKIPYLELLGLTGLLSGDEIRLLIQETSSHEYKIQRKHRTLDDFMRYIQHQLKLLEQLKKRREEMNYFHKTELIEDAIKNHVSSLFGVANKQFFNRLELWSARINFARSQGWATAVRKHFEQVTKILGKQYPQLWIEASNFEWSMRPPTNVDTARKILQLGLRDHPDSEALFVAAFRLEIEYLNFLESKPKLLEKLLSQENGDLIVNKLALAKVIYKTAKISCKQKSENFFLKFFLALNDANPARTEDLLGEIKRDADEDLNSRLTQKQAQVTDTSVEDIVRTQFLNFSLFFSNIEEAVKALKKAENVQDISFWTSVFCTIQSHSNSLKMSDWYRFCLIPKSAAVVVHLRIWVLNYYSLSYSNGTDKARKWYEKIKSIFPTSPAIHLAMIEVEKKACQLDVQRVRSILDSTVLLHGRESADPWLEYIRFEKGYCSKDNRHSLIYARALRELTPSLQDEFRRTIIQDSQT